MARKKKRDQFGRVILKPGEETKLPSEIPTGEQVPTKSVPLPPQTFGSQPDPSPQALPASVATTARGQTFVGLSPQEVRDITLREDLRKGTVEGGLKAGADIRAAQQLSEAQVLAQAVGDVQLIGDVKKDKFSIEQAIKSALASASAGLLGGAALGAAGGAIATAPAGGIGAIPGAVAIGGAGAVGGFITGFRSNLKTQRADMLKGEAINLRKQESNMLRLVSEVHRGGDPISSLDLFNEQDALIAQNYARLQLETTDSESLWLGEDGKVQLEKFESYYTSSREVLIFMMQNAILRPDPLRVIPTVEEFEETT